MADREALHDGPPRIDCHAHVFHRGMVFAPGAHSHPDYDYRTEDWLADMAAHGITHGVIAAASLYGENSEYTLEALAAHANLRATVILPPDTSLPTLSKLASKGVSGIRLVWRQIDPAPDLTSEEWRGFLGRLADAGMHVQLLISGDRLDELVPLINSAGPMVVIDHFGAPSREAGGVERAGNALVRLVERGNCRVKLSAAFRLPRDTARAIADRMLKDVGPDYLLWGSDAPFVNHEDTIDYQSALATFADLVPERDARAAMDRTAMRLFFGSEENL